MPSVPHPTRRRLLAAGAFAMTGIIGDGGAVAEPLPATPQCRDGDEPHRASPSSVAPAGVPSTSMSND